MFQYWWNKILTIYATVMWTLWHKKCKKNFQSLWKFYYPLCCQRQKDHHQKVCLTSNICNHPCMVPFNDNSTYPVVYIWSLIVVGQIGETIFQMRIQATNLIWTLPMGSFFEKKPLAKKIILNEKGRHFSRWPPFLSRNTTFTITFDSLYRF